MHLSPKRLQGDSRVIEREEALAEPETGCTQLQGFGQFGIIRFQAARSDPYRKAIAHGLDGLKGLCSRPGYDHPVGAAFKGVRYPKFDGFVQQDHPRADRLNINKQGHAQVEPFQSQINHPLHAAGFDLLFVPQDEGHHQGVGAQVQRIRRFQKGNILDRFRRQHKVIPAQRVGPVSPYQQGGILAGA
jgi:hypothetical protein